MAATDSPADTTPAFTSLVPGPGGIAAEDLAAHYRYPDSSGGRRPWVRANFISSTDGAATISGRSGGLGGAGDHAIFGVLRELADIIVVGAGTVRAENYSGARLPEAAQARRRDRGQAPIPRIAVVTRSGHLDADLKIFTRTEVTPLVLTSRSAAPAVRERLGDLAEVIDCSGTESGDAHPDELDPGKLVAAAVDGGGHRILTEGGPSLLNTLLVSGLVDELCLTIAPVLAGGDAPRIAHGPDAGSPTAVRCEHLLTDTSGYLYARYVKSA